MLKNSQQTEKNQTKITPNEQTKQKHQNKQSYEIKPRVTKKFRYVKADSGM